MALELENILITGSSGFIGGNLTTYLKEKNILYTPFFWDLLHKESIVAFFSSHSITQIVHLVWTFEGNFETQMQMNFQTTKNLLEVANEFGVKKIIFTSTGATYGEPILSESFESDFQSPNTWYGLSKKFGEELIQYYSQNFGFTSVILRYPNVYGKWSRWVISSFQRSILEKWKITVYGDGSQSRNFLHISDAVHAIYLAIKHEESDVFNITNPVKTSLNELIEFLQTRYDFEVEYREKNDNGLLDLLLSSQKAWEILGFEAVQKNILID